MKIKSLYGVLFLSIIVWLGFFTYINLTYYASVMEVNMAILPLMLIFPLYDGYKRKVYLKKMLMGMYLIFISFVVVVLIALPKYTYSDAKLMIEKNERVEVEDILKKYKDGRSLFYKGDYYLPVGQNAYIFNFQEGTYYYE